MSALLDRPSATAVSTVQPNLYRNAPERKLHSIGRPVVFSGLGLLLAGQSALLLTGAWVPVLVSILGFFCAVGIPSFLLYMAGVGRVGSRTERVAKSIIFTILLLMGAGLAANTLLPALGVQAALGTAPMTGTVDLLCLGMAAWSYGRHPRRYSIRLPAWSSRDKRLLGLSSLTVLLSVTGAIRLNNGAGGGVTLVMLFIALVTFALAIAWRDSLETGTLPTVLYCVSLALLLMTSLRGWYTTGHDIQREYHVFELAKTHSDWSMARFRDAYNACLSITILPTLLWHWTRVPDPYVYKIFFQALFALCPVVVYRIGTRVASRTVALIGTIYFVSFVTFFQDMPMLDRQEIGFLLLGAALLAAFSGELPLRRRRAWFVAFAAGMVVSHYSTTYVMVTVLGIMWAIRAGSAALPRAWCKTRKRPSGRADVFNLATVVAVAALAFIWTVPLTHTGGGVSTTADSVVSSLLGRSSGARSSDTSYSLFSLSRPTPTQRLADYSRTSLEQTARLRAKGVYYNQRLLDRYPTPASPPMELPLTSLGHMLAHLGINVAAANYAIRQASARLLQLFIAIGLLITLTRRRRRHTLDPAFTRLAVASMVVVLFQVVLPNISVDYGLLRAFQQALLALNVFLAIGTLTLFCRLRPSRQLAAASFVVLAFFASSTGIFTQLLGGYDPQLHLNNSGTYYSIYYVHPQEVAGITWLQHRTSINTQRSVQSEVQTDRYTFTRLQNFVGVSTTNDIFPPLVRRDAYVFLGYSNVRDGQSTTSIDGDLVTYQYPMAFLNENKDLIYDNGGARVYR